MDFVRLIYPHSSALRAMNGGYDKSDLSEVLSLGTVPDGGAYLGRVGRRDGAPEGCHSASCKFAGSPGEFIEPAKIKQKKLNSNA